MMNELLSIMQLKLFIKPKLKLLLMKKIVKLSFIIAMLLSFVNLSWGQQRIISGQVTDENEVGLPGATIIEKSTTNGTVSDVNGNYSIAISEDAEVLKFSFVGMESQEVVLGSSNTYNVQLKASSIGLDEVVAVGYGTMKKRDLTGAVSSVKSDELVRANPLSAESALQGQVAGVVITKENSRPGAGYDINIRGLNSISYSNEPLVVIDGIMDGDMNSLNPSDIQTIDILKDASSTAIYGSRGANGVVIITTKKGKEGKPTITYDGYVGIKTPAHLPDMQTAEEWYQASRVDRAELGYSLNNYWTETEQYNVDNGKYVNWIDEVTEPGVQTSHTVSLSGGDSYVKYYGSLGYLQEDGNLIYTGYKRYNLNASMDAKINKFIKVGFSTKYRYSQQDLGSSESLRSAYRARPTGVMYYDDVVNPTDREINWNGYAVWMGMADSQVINPLVEAHPDNYQTQMLTSDFIGNTFIQLNPVKGLSIKSSFSARMLNDRKGEYRGTLTKSQKTSRDPVAMYDTRIFSTYTWDNIVNYNRTFGIHKINATAGQSIYKRKEERSEMDVENLSYNSLWYGMGNAATVKKHNTSLTERTLSSFMGRFVYDLNNKYLLTLTGRYDGASQLAEGHKWDFFPSVAFAWRAGEESFIKSIETISSLKLRASYGIVGNAAVSPYITQASVTVTPYSFGDTPTQGYYPSNLADKFLGWEKSKEINLGVDFGLFNNRISGSVEWYKRNTDDLIYKQKVPQSTGFNEAITNIGEVQNNGIEAVLNTVNVNKGGFKWSTNLNFAANRNEVISIGSDEIKQDIGSGLFVGQPIDANYYLEFDGIWQLDEEELAASYGQIPGTVKVVDQNKDGVISNDDDRIVLGSRSPDWTMGVTNRFEYKNFDFSFLVYTSQGVQYYNNMLRGTMGEIGSGRYNALNLDYWMPDNPINDYYTVGGRNPYRNAINYQDASYIRVKDITLGYTCTKQFAERLKMKNLRVYTQVINPLVFHNFDGMDPEFNSGVYNDDVPSVTFLFGIKCSF